jgi:pyruvate kinase
MSRISSGLPIFALSDNHATLQRLALCRGVIPLYFDARMFEPEVIEERAVEFLKDGRYVVSGDSIILTKGAIMGQTGSTNILKILNVV